MSAMNLFGVLVIIGFSFASVSFAFHNLEGGDGPSGDDVGTYTSFLGSSEQESSKKEEITAGQYLFIIGEFPPGHENEGSDKVELDLCAIGVLTLENQENGSTRMTINMVKHKSYAKTQEVLHLQAGISGIYILQGVDMKRLMELLENPAVDSTHKWWQQTAIDEIAFVKKTNTLSYTAGHTYLCTDTLIIGKKPQLGGHSVAEAGEEMTGQPEPSDEAKGKPEASNEVIEKPRTSPKWTVASPKSTQRNTASQSPNPASPANATGANTRSRRTITILIPVTGISPHSLRKSASTIGKRGQNSDGSPQIQ